MLVSTRENDTTYNTTRESLDVHVATLPMNKYSLFVQGAFDARVFVVKYKTDRSGRIVRPIEGKVMHGDCQIGNVLEVGDQMYLYGTGIEGPYLETWKNALDWKK